MSSSRELRAIVAPLAAALAAVKRSKTSDRSHARRDNRRRCRPSPAVAAAARRRPSSSDIERRSPVILHFDQAANETLALSGMKTMRALIHAYEKSERRERALVAAAEVTRARAHLGAACDRAGSNRLVEARSRAPTTRANTRKRGHRLAWTGRRRLSSLVNQLEGASARLRGGHTRASTRLRQSMRPTSALIGSSGDSRRHD